MAGSERVKAYPSKIFFINMLTRDISVSDCILDLLDNSIDSILTEEKVNTLELLENGYINHTSTIFTDKVIEITLSSNEFSIIDNCFGIDRNTAINYAFRFGSDGPRVISKSGLSVYGIGMKRAFFKIGNDIQLISETKDESYQINIDVEKWAQEVDWDFYLDDKTKTPNHTGTSIKIKNLNPSISKKFSDEKSISELKDKIAKTFSVFISSGLSIIINGESLSSSLPEFTQSSDIEISRKKIEQIIDSKRIDILILVGIGNTKTRGWYVFCNGRLILRENTDYRTGWGVEYPNYHPKYNAFSGIIFFSSPNVELLPWTTTKEDVEIDSSLYQSAINEAKILARPYLNFLNNAYPDKEDSDDSEIHERKIMKQATPVTINKIATKDNQFIYSPPKKEKSDKEQINFYAKTEDIKKIKTHLGKPRISKSKLGEMIFDYYLDMEDLK